MRMADLVLVPVHGLSGIYDQIKFQTSVGEVFRASQETIQVVAVTFAVCKAAAFYDQVTLRYKSCICLGCQLDKEVNTEATVRYSCRSPCHLARCVLHHLGNQAPCRCEHDAASAVQIVQRHSPWCYPPVSAQRLG